MRFGKVGSSDVIGVLPDGKFLAVEVKASRGRLSVEQAAFLEKIRGLGGMAIVVKSWHELDAALRLEGYVNDGPLFEGNSAAPYGGA
jgi:hypothetical protein